MAGVKRINEYIEHTLLKPDATAHDIERLCREAREHSFLGVCVNGSWIALARRLLEGCNCRIISVAGFPLGAMAGEAKCFEAETAVQAGAQEIDFVLNIGRLKQNDSEYVRKEIAEVVRSAAGCPVKVILETCLLTREEKIRACRLAVEAGAHFVKTSTGFGSSGATVDDVRLMRETVGPEFGVKAAGGIKDLEAALAMIDAGANRIGASASVAMVRAVNEKP